VKKIEKLESSKPRKTSKKITPQFLEFSIPEGYQAVLAGEIDIEERLKILPSEPGIYLMKDELGNVIYIGKAKNLRSRVRSYFQDSADHSAKTLHLVSKIKSFDLLQSPTELEALILENEFIKKYKPKYNLRLKDDKSYPFIKIDRSHEFPRAYIARRQILNDGNDYLGPFPASGLLRIALHTASKLFQIRDCRDHEFANRSRPCISFEMGTCSAPCVLKVSKEVYAKQIDEFTRFLKGENQDHFLESWRNEMETSADAMDFERAAKLRDRIQAAENMQRYDQRVTSLNQNSNQDVWALWPPTHEERLQADFLVAQVLHVRGGKLLASLAFSAELLETQIEEECLTPLLLQFYRKHSLTNEILLPDSPLSAEDLDNLSRALVQLSPKIVDSHDSPEFAEGVEGMSPILGVASSKNESLALFEMAQSNAKAHAEELRKIRVKKADALQEIADLLELEQPPRRMECLDISNMQGEANVASCVVFIDGQPDKSEYRHYKIQGVEGQNDFASMKEVMIRRYGKPDSPRPDLLVIDGGRGQISAVCEILKELGFRLEVVGLAKARVKSDFKSSEVESSEERLFLPNQKNYIRIKNPAALKLLTHIRDEAHRFAIEFHRVKRSENRGL